MSADDRPAAFVEVSPEMTALFAGWDDRAPAPADAVALSFQPPVHDQPGVLRRHGGLPPDEPAADAFGVLFLVSEAAVRRLGGDAFLDAPEAVFHLTAELRDIVAALREPRVAPASVATYRLGKSIELLCVTLRQFDDGALVPAGGEGALSAADTRRVMAARRMVDERWSEKLTLESIARACGLNRAKLTRGFRDLFDCTVAEALAARRLTQASRLLLTTDLPVGLVGYEAGYHNNASFARAFGRRFGRTPSSFRAEALAA